MMTESEKTEFDRILFEVAEFYGIDVSPMSARYWNTMAPRVDIATFSAAIDAHIAKPGSGRFFPKPADLFEILESARTDGHITSDEAWAIALESYDESATVCVTPEILQARSAAQPIMDEGDKVGARMAFKSAYERIMADPAVAHRRPGWFMSLGHDPEGRRAACDRAAALGRIGTGQATFLLGPPDDEDATPLLDGNASGMRRLFDASSTSDDKTH